MSGFYTDLLLALVEAKNLSGGLGRQGFAAKKYYPKAWRFFCSNPKGIGLANRRGITLPQQKPKTLINILL